MKEPKIELNPEQLSYAFFGISIQELAQKIHKDLSSKKEKDKSA